MSALPTARTAGAIRRTNGGNGAIAKPHTPIWSHRAFTRRLKSCALRRQNRRGNRAHQWRYGRHCQPANHAYPQYPPLPPPCQALYKFFPFPPAPAENPPTPHKTAHSPTYQNFPEITQFFQDFPNIFPEVSRKFLVFSCHFRQRFRRKSRKNRPKSANFRKKRFTALG